MKFPEQYCVPTHLLTKESYSNLICRMVSEGHVNLIPHLNYDLMMCWGYIGITEHGTVDVYDHPWSFLKINAWMDYRDVKDQDYPNVWDSEQLKRYLK